MKVEKFDEKASLTPYNKIIFSASLLARSHILGDWTGNSSAFLKVVVEPTCGSLFHIISPNELCVIHFDNWDLNLYLLARLETAVVFLVCKTWVRCIIYALALLLTGIVFVFAK